MNPKLFLIALCFLVLSCTSERYAEVELKGTDVVLTTPDGAVQCFKPSFIIFYADNIIH